MKVFQIIPALLILGGAFATAEEAAFTQSAMAPASISATGNLVAAPLPEHRRTAVLVLGIVAVAVTFQRGLKGGSRQTKRS